MTGSGQWLDPETLRSSSELQDRLVAAFRGDPAIGMMAVTNRHGSFFARWPSESAPDENQPIRIGCLSKVFTATLASFAARQGSLSFEQDLGELRQLAGINITQLLSHTHGLDSSGLWSVPRLGDRRIDLESLSRAALTTRRIGAAGQVYSYGNFGAWFVGGLLEQSHDRSYGELLADFLKRLGDGHSVSGDAGPDGFVEMCPGTAGPAGISPAALLDLLRLHLDDEAMSAQTRAPSFAVRGWSTEKAVTPGWKFYGDGWYGHSAQLSDWAATLRLHPAKQVGWFFASAHTGQFLLQTRLFGASMPDVRYLAVPRPLRPDAVNPTDLEACEGTYENAAHTLAVGCGEGRTLQAQIHSRCEDGSCADRQVRLQPAGPRLYLVAPSIPDLLTIGHFLGDGPRPEYLWNGRQLFRRRLV